MITSTIGPKEKSWNLQKMKGKQQTYLYLKFHFIVIFSQFGDSLMKNKERSMLLVLFGTHATVTYLQLAWEATISQNRGWG